MGEQTQPTETPSCTFTKMKENWEEELHNPDFLSNFGDYFNPWSNDVSIAWNLQTGLLEKQEDELGVEIKEREAEDESGGFKAVKGPLDEENKTPGGLVAQGAALMLSKATGKEETYTEDPWGIANAIATFTNTLIGKLSDRLFKEGLALLSGEGEEGETTSEGGGYGSSSGLYSAEAEVSYGGTAAAQMRFAEFLEAGFVTGGPYQVLNNLTVCPDPNKPGASQCVIDERFWQAIENKTQVRNLDADILQRPFGVIGRQSDTGEALEPSYKEGFPLRSLIILRKYRIIPVGWELAGQYISQFSEQTYNLGDLVAINDPKSGKYNPQSPFFGLIDPDWVLKAPENYCRRQGPGPEVTQTN